MSTGIDFNKLRKDLVDYYGTAVYSGFPVTFFEASRMESISQEELLKEALKSNLDLNKYKKTL